MEDNYYLCLLEKNYVKFDPVSQITNVFFDDTKNQIFIVKSVSVSVKSIGLADQIESLSFSIDSAPIIAIKFNSDNSVLAIQRTETSLELAPFINNQLLPTSKIFYETKKTILYGFFWTQPNELVIVSADHVEVFQINTSKRSMKSLKSINVSSNWFVWNRSNLAVLTSNNGMVMTPLILQKSGSMTKLASIQIEDEPGVTERDVNTGILYGNPAILLLRTSKSRSLEIWVYLLDGPSFRKSHILKLGFSGRVAISIIDSLIIVHHQTLKISLVFDIGIASECDPHNKSVMIHSPIVPGKSIRPFTIKMPSVLKESALNVELYSANWVIFQPDIIIDVKLGYLFKLSLAIEKIQISDKLKHVDFLMNRQGAKPQLLSVLLETVTPNDCNELLHLPVLEALFDKINKVYKQKVDHDLLKIQALPSPSGFKSFSTAVASGSPQPPSKVVIEQSDILQLLNTIIDKDLMEKVLMVYIFSIVKNSISCEYELSKVLVITLVGSHKVRSIIVVTKCSLYITNSF